MYFKLVIGNLLSAQLMFPEMRAKVDAMAPEAMHPWDEYTSMMRELAEALPATTLLQVGKKIVRESKGHFMSQGFGSADAILSDWAKLFEANIHGAPPRDLVRTVEHAPGMAVLLAGAAQPAALVEGYMRGVVEMFGHQVQELKVRAVKRRADSYNELRIRWS
jgi:hypothetical protein